MGNPGRPARQSPLAFKSSPPYPAPRTKGNVCRVCLKQLFIGATAIYQTHQRGRGKHVLRCSRAYANIPRNVCVCVYVHTHIRFSHSCFFVRREGRGGWAQDCSRCVGAGRQAALSLHSLGDFLFIAAATFCNHIHACVEVLAQVIMHTNCCCCAFCGYGRRAWGTTGISGKSPLNGDAKTSCQHSLGDI